MERISRSQKIAEEIHAFAENHQMVYRQTELDVWADHVTRLAGDDVQFDETEQLVIALQRAGFLTRRAAVLLHTEYLREAEP